MVVGAKALAELIALSKPVDTPATSSGRYRNHSLDRGKTLKNVIMPGKNKLNPIFFHQRHQHRTHIHGIRNAVAIVVIVAMGAGRADRVMHVDDFPGAIGRCQFALQPRQLNGIFTDIVLIEKGDTDGKERGWAMVESIIGFRSRLGGGVVAGAGIVLRQVIETGEHVFSLIPVVIADGWVDGHRPLPLHVDAVEP